MSEIEAKEGGVKVGARLCVWLEVVEWIALLPFALQGSNASKLVLLK